MRFALFYSDTEQFITADNDRSRAVALARELSRETAREITVVFNSPKGDVAVCCKYRGAEREVIDGQCLHPLLRWWHGLWRRRSG